MADIILIEGLFYAMPHQPEIYHDHPAMRGVWRLCQQLLRDHPNSYLAPLLHDDLCRNGGRTTSQTVEQVIGKAYESLHWFAKPVIESEIANRYGDRGCEAFDSIYHRDVILPLSVIYPDWRWIVVHPVTFQEQQSGMLEKLWRIIFGGLNLAHIARKRQATADVVRAEIREKFFGRFTHHWIGSDGHLCSVTQPVWRGKNVVHVGVIEHVQPHINRLSDPEAGYGMCPH